MRHVQPPLVAAVTVLLFLCNTGCVSAFLPVPVPASTLNGPLIPNDEIQQSSSLYHGRIRVPPLPQDSRLAKTETTALRSITVASIGAGVATFYQTFPLLAGFLTCSTKAAFADSMAQYRDVCTTKFNLKRNIAMVLYSGTVLGISCEIMYNKVFPILFGTEQSIARILKMTLFDGFINAPLLWLPPAYIAQALVYRYPKRNAIQNYITDVKENGLLKKYWSLWLPMSTINFSLVPPHFRVAFVAAVSFFWMIILSVVANNDQDPDSCPVEPAPAMRYPRAFD